MLALMAWELGRKGGRGKRDRTFCFFCKASISAVMVFWFCSKSLNTTG